MGSSEEGRFISGVRWGNHPGCGGKMCDRPQNISGSLAGRKEGRMPLANRVALTRHTPWDFPGGTAVKNPPANAGGTGSRPGPGRSHMPRSN